MPIVQSNEGQRLSVHEMDESQAETLELIWVDQSYQGENFARVIERCLSCVLRTVAGEE